MKPCIFILLCFTFVLCSNNTFDCANANTTCLLAPKSISESYSQLLKNPPLKVKLRTIVMLILCNSGRPGANNSKIIEQAINTLFEMGADAKPGIRILLNRKVPQDVRIRIMHGLHKIGPEFAVKHLIRILKQNEPHDIKTAAINNIVKLNGLEGLNLTQIPQRFREALLQAV